MKLEACLSAALLAGSMSGCKSDPYVYTPPTQYIEPEYVFNHEMVNYYDKSKGIGVLGPFISSFTYTMPGEQTLRTSTQYGYNLMNLNDEAITLHFIQGHVADTGDGLISQRIFHSEAFGRPIQRYASSFSRALPPGVEYQLSDNRLRIRSVPDMLVLEPGEDYYFEMSTAGYDFGEFHRVSFDVAFTHRHRFSRLRMQTRWVREEQ